MHLLVAVGDGVEVPVAYYSEHFCIDLGGMDVISFLILTFAMFLSFRLELEFELGGKGV